MASTQSLEELRSGIGQPVGTSNWILIDQQRIDGFAELTEDRQFIHVDPERAAATAMGGTIAHGFLTLSLLSRMAEEVVPTLPGTSMTLNYGLERLRFLAPVRSGRRIRGIFTLLDIIERGPGQLLLRWSVTMEIEREPKPALSTEWLTLIFLEGA